MSVETWLSARIVGALVKRGHLQRVEFSRRYPVAGVVHEKAEYQIRGPVVLTKDTERGLGVDS